MTAVKKLIDRALSRWYISNANHKEEMAAMEHAYMVLADARAQQGLESLMESQLAKTNNELIESIAACRGTGWASWNFPPDTQTKTVPTL